MPIKLTQMSGSEDSEGDFGEQNINTPGHVLYAYHLEQ